MKRYKFLEHDKITLPTGEVLTRIQYTAAPCKDMVGGYIEKEDNLPHTGVGVVHHDAMVYGDAVVWGGHVLNDAQVYEEARIYGEARISGKARICGSASLSGTVKVMGDAVIKGILEDDVQVQGNALVEGGVYNNAVVSDDAVITKDGWVFGGNITGQAVISTSVSGNIYVSGDAHITKSTDLCHIQQGVFASSVTVYKTENVDGIEGLGCGLCLDGAYYYSVSIKEAMNKVATRPDVELLKRFIELGVMSVATPEMAMSYGFPLGGK